MAESVPADQTQPGQKSKPLTRRASGGQIEKVTPPDPHFLPVTVSPASTSTICSFILHQVQAEAWVQCERPSCLKWRRIPKNVADTLTDTDPWFCDLNVDPRHQVCSAPEEDYRAADRLVKKCKLKYRFSAMEDGTLVWAKMAGYCKWPAVISPDPEDGQSRVLDQDGEALSYHVEYLGLQHSHNWVHTRFVELYGTREQSLSEECAQGTKKRKRSTTMYKGSTCMTMYKGNNVQCAIQEANDWLVVMPGERIQKCQFRFSPNSRIAIDIGHSSHHLESRHFNNPTFSKFSKSRNLCMAKKPSVKYHNRLKSFASPHRKPSFLQKLNHHKTFKSKDKMKTIRNSSAVERRKEKTNDKSSSQKMPSRVESDIDGDEIKWTTFSVNDDLNDSQILDHKPGSAKTSTRKRDKTLPSMSALLPIISQETSTRAEAPPHSKCSSPSQPPPPYATQHSMVNRSKEEKFSMDIETYLKNQETFDKDVRKFWKKHGININRVPTWHSVPVTLYQIYLAVCDRGGYEAVTRKKKWASVYRELSGFPSTSGTPAKHFYQKYLLPYDLYLRKEDYRHLIPKKSCSSEIKHGEEQTVSAETKDAGVHDQNNLDSPADSDDSSSYCDLEELESLMEDLRTHNLPADLHELEKTVDILPLAFYDENTPDMGHSPNIQLLEVDEFKNLQTLPGDTCLRPKKSVTFHSSTNILGPTSPSQHKSDSDMFSNASSISGKFGNLCTLPILKFEPSGEETTLEDLEDTDLSKLIAKLAKETERNLRNLEKEEQILLSATDPSKMNLKTEPESLLHQIMIACDAKTEKPNYCETLSTEGVANQQQQQQEIYDLPMKTTFNSMMTTLTAKQETLDTLDQKETSTHIALGIKNGDNFYIGAEKDRHVSSDAELTKNHPDSNTEQKNVSDDSKIVKIPVLDQLMMKENIPTDVVYPPRNKSIETRLFFEPIDPNTLQPIGCQVTFDDATLEPIPAPLTLGPFTVKPVSKCGSSQSIGEDGSERSVLSDDLVFHELTALQQELDSLGVGYEFTG